MNLDTYPASLSSNCNIANHREAEARSQSILHLESIFLLVFKKNVNPLKYVLKIPTTITSADCVSITKFLNSNHRFDLYIILDYKQDNYRQHLRVQNCGYSQDILH